MLTYKSKYIENLCLILIKEIKTKQGIPFLWVGTVNLVKVSIFPKMILTQRAETTTMLIT